MAEVKRYQPAQHMRLTEDHTTRFSIGCMPVVNMVDLEDGNYVLYADYAALERRLHLMARALEMVCDASCSQDWDNGGHPWDVDGWLKEAEREIDAEKGEG